MRTFEFSRSISLLALVNEFWGDFQAHECMDAPRGVFTPTGAMRKYTLSSGEVVIMGCGYSGAHDVPEPQKPKGGKRQGSGRKALDDAGTVIATVRLTVKQKQNLDRLGGARWVRDQLNLFADS